MMEDFNRNTKTRYHSS